MDGTRRLDASVMEGDGLKAGSVVGLQGIRNPIKAARLVLDLPHVMLTNVGVGRIARAHQLATLRLPTKEEIARLNKIKKSDIEAMKLYSDISRPSAPWRAIQKETSQRALLPAATGPCCPAG
jgi:isoaspartyl peptidase/L-asparaginase-like protein (Ntn-hydrolase superfamily)